MSSGGRVCIAAVIVSVAVLVAAVPALSADTSSAYEMKEGSSSVYFRTSDALASDVIDRLYTDDGKREFAQYAVNLLGISASAEDAAVSCLTLEMARGDSVEDGRHKVFFCDCYEADISCKVSPVGLIFNDPDGWNEDLYRYFNDNTVAAGDTISVQGHLRLSKSAGTETEYVSNGDGNLVLTGSETSYEVRIVLDTVTVTLTGTAGTRTAEFDMEYTDIRNVVAEYDFGDTDPEESSSSTMVLVEYGYEDSYWSEDYSYDGEVSGSHSDDLFNGDYGYRYMDELPANQFTGATVVSADISCGATGFYGSGSGYLFSEVADPSLQSDGSLGEFLSTVGTVSYDYRDAGDMYADLITPPSYSSTRRLMVIGSIGVLLSVAALAILFYLSRRK